MLAKCFIYSWILCFLYTLYGGCNMFGFVRICVFVKKCIKATGPVVTLKLHFFPPPPPRKDRFLTQAYKVWFQQDFRFILSTTLYSNKSERKKDSLFNIIIIRFQVQSAQLYGMMMVLNAMMATLGILCVYSSWKSTGCANLEGGQSVCMNGIYFLNNGCGTCCLEVIFRS